MSQTTQVAEIVTFRLLEGSDPNAFAQAASGMTPFLQATGAARTRHLSVDEDGLWTDHIIWTDLASAKDAAARIMAEPAAAPFMQMIDPETVSMRHAPVHFQLQME